MIKLGNLTSRVSKWQMALLAFVPGALLICCLPGLAETPPGPADVDIRVAAGFGGLSISRLGGWVPFRIIVTNQGPPINGRLIVFAPAPSSHQSREFSEDVQLPTGSKKLYEIEAYLNSTQMEPVVRLVQHSSSGDRVVTEAPVKIEQESGVPGDQVEIAVVDIDEAAVGSINSVPIDINHTPFTAAPAGGAGGNASPRPTPNLQPPGPGGRFSMYALRVLKARPVVIGPSDLPGGFGSYDALDAVVLGGAPLSQVTPDQGKALRLWVAAGGNLIVTGGTDFSGMRPSGLEAVLPVDVLGTETASALPELTSLYGAFESADPILIARARPRPGAKVLVGTTDRPVIVERQFGKGSVRYVAIDPRHSPVRAWQGSAALWQDVLLPAAQFRQRRFSLANFNGQMSGALYNMANVKPPAASHLLLFLLAYLVVVGPLNYFGLRYARKLDLAWATIPVVVVVFTAFSIVAAQTSRGSDLVAASISGVEVYQQEGLTRTTGDLLLVFPSKSLHEVIFDNDARVNDASLIASGDPIATTYHSNNTSLAIPTDKWAPISFRVRELAEGQNPIVSVDVAAAGVMGGSVKVKNLSSFAISRAVVLTRAGMTGLFDIGPGEERRFELQVPAAQTFSGWYASQVNQGSPDAQVLSYLAPSYPYAGATALGADLFSTMLPDLITQLDRPLLVGLGENEEPRFGYTGAVKRINRQMYIVHL